MGEEEGAEVVLACVKEESLDAHATRPPGPSTEEANEPSLAHERSGGLADAPVLGAADIPLLARLHRVHWMADRADRHPGADRSEDAGGACREALLLNYQCEARARVGELEKDAVL